MTTPKTEHDRIAAEWSAAQRLVRDDPRRGLEAYFALITTLRALCGEAPGYWGGTLDMVLEEVQDPNLAELLSARQDHLVGELLLESVDRYRDEHLRGGTDPLDFAKRLLAVSEWFERRGRFDEALGLAKEALELRRQHGRAFFLLFSELRRVSLLAHRSGDLYEARYYFEELIAQMRDQVRAGGGHAIRNREALAALFGPLARRREETGDLTGARQALEEGIAMMRELLAAGEMQLQRHRLGERLGHCAELLERLGEYEAAVEAARESVEVYRVEAEKHGELRNRHAAAQELLRRLESAPR